MESYKEIQARFPSFEEIEVAEAKYVDPFEEICEKVYRRYNLKWALRRVHHNMFISKPFEETYREEILADYERIKLEEQISNLYKGEEL